jgi:hypothetical protein
MCPAHATSLSVDAMVFDSVRALRCTSTRLKQKPRENITYVVSV